jgi:hypothetical protein
MYTFGAAISGERNVPASDCTTVVLQFQVWLERYTSWSLFFFFFFYISTSPERVYVRLTK